MSATWQRDTVPGLDRTVVGDSLCPMVRRSYQCIPSASSYTSRFQKRKTKTSAISGNTWEEGEKADSTKELACFP